MAEAEDSTTNIVTPLMPYLVAYWMLGIPLGIQAPYAYP